MNTSRFIVYNPAKDKTNIEVLIHCKLVPEIFFSGEIVWFSIVISSIKASLLLNISLAITEWQMLKCSLTVAWEGSQSLKAVSVISVIQQYGS